MYTIHAACIIGSHAINTKYDWCPDNTGHGGNEGPIWGRQGLGGPMNFAIWVIVSLQCR